jgi:predicted nucleic acid-binding protein
LKPNGVGDSAQDLVERTLSATGDQQVALSSVGLTELVHGIYRAHSPTARRRRQVFIEDLVAGLTVYPYTADTALLAGKIDGEQTARGVIIPFADLMIGVTALSIGFAMLTVNERHFRLIPGLQVIQL